MSTYTDTSNKVKGLNTSVTTVLKAAERCHTLTPPHSLVQQHRVALSCRIHGSVWVRVLGSGALTFQQHRAEKAAGGWLGGARVPDRPSGVLLPNSSSSSAAGASDLRGSVPVSAGSARPECAGCDEWSSGPGVPERLPAAAGLPAGCALLLRSPVRAVCRSAGRWSGDLPGGGRVGHPWPMGDSGERCRSHTLLQVMFAVLVCWQFNYLLFSVMHLPSHL